MEHLQKVSNTQISGYKGSIRYRCRDPNPVACYTTVKLDNDDGFVHGWRLCLTNVGLHVKPRKGFFFNAEWVWSRTCKPERDGEAARGDGPPRTAPAFTPASSSHAWGARHMEAFSHKSQSAPAASTTQSTLFLSTYGTVPDITWTWINKTTCASEIHPFRRTLTS